MTELRKEISSVFNMTRFLCNSLEHSLEKAFTLEEIHKFKRVVMTGCGDSLYASMAAKECFEELTGRMVDVPTCIDLARHYDARRFGEPGETLVLLRKGLPCCGSRTARQAPRCRHRWSDP